MNRKGSALIVSAIALIILASIGIGIWYAMPRAMAPVQQSSPTNASSSPVTATMPQSPSGPTPIFADFRSCWAVQKDPNSSYMQYRMCGTSMIPAYTDAEIVTYNPNYTSLQRGDVIVFQAPHGQSGTYSLKRIIALPGESIQIVNNTVKIFNGDHPDGFILNEPYISGPVAFPKGITTSPVTGKVALNAHQYFVMGDYRLGSYDSRYYGPIDKAQVLGLAIK